MPVYRLVISSSFVTLSTVRMKSLLLSIQSGKWRLLVLLSQYLVIDHWASSWPGLDGHSCVTALHTVLVAAIIVNAIKLEEMLLTQFSTKFNKCFIKFWEILDTKTNTRDRRLRT